MSDHLPDAGKMVPAPITLAGMRKAVAWAIMTPSAREYTEKYYAGVIGPGYLADADRAIAAIAASIPRHRSSLIRSSRILAVTSHDLRGCGDTYADGCSAVAALLRALADAADAR